MLLLIQGQSPEQCSEWEISLSCTSFRTTLGHQEKFQQCLIFFNICGVGFHYSPGVVSLLPLLN